MKDTPLRESKLVFDHKEQQAYDRSTDLFVPIEDEKYLPIATQQHIRELRNGKQAASASTS